MQHATTGTPHVTDPFASVVVAFWWLQYYAGFDSHLKQNFPGVFENERLTVFRLTV